MITLAYRSIDRTGAHSWSIGAVSDRPLAHYLWHYWIPSFALLDRKRLCLRRLADIQAGTETYVYPIELRWEFLELFAHGVADIFLTPHIPAAVLLAAREKRAVILVFFGHEARPMSFVYKDGRVLSGYDLLHAFVKQNDLPEGAVWFVHGSLDGEHEFQEWKKARGIPHVAPFEVRSLEPYSYMAKQTRLTHQDGFNLSVNWDIDPDHGGHTYKSIQLELVPLDRPLAEIYANIPNENAPPPSKLFLCMNRVVRPHRRLIVCFLQRIGLLDKSLVSFREENPSQTRFDDPGLQTAWEDVQKKLPLTIDRDLPLDNVAYARGNFAAVSIGEAYPYRQAYFNIVNETHFFSSVRFVSEKIWKPILNGQPFMVVGTPGSLAYVQSLGFKTFAPRIDESYDAIVDDDHRMKSLFLLIGRLGQMSLRQWADLHQELKPIADFNAELLQSIRTPMELVFDEIAAHLSQKTNGSSY